MDAGNSGPVDEGGRAANSGPVGPGYGWLGVSMQRRLRRHTMAWADANRAVLAGHFAALRSQHAMTVGQARQRLVGRSVSR